MASLGETFVTQSYVKGKPKMKKVVKKTVKKTVKKSSPMVEKKTGEKYVSKSAMKAHEKKEPMSMMIKEYGMKAAMKKMAAKKKGK